MRKIIIAGGTGFIGAGLADFLSQKGYAIVLLSRNAAPSSLQYEHLVWDAHSEDGTWPTALENAYAIINLAGRSVDCIKTPDQCDEILRSRVESTKILGKVVEGLKSPPKVWIQMSTTHIYGDPLSIVCDEESSTGYGLAPEVGRAWESTFKSLKLNGIRRVILRTSFVLGQKGGAMTTLSALTKIGLGGHIGHGKQGMSWIHQTDLNKLFLEALKNHEMEGIYNATSPNPVSNHDFMSALRRSLRIPFGIKSPAFIVRLGAKYFFKTDPELALYGRYCVSNRLSSLGFEFEYPEIYPALLSLVKK